MHNILEYSMPQNACINTNHSYRVPRSNSMLRDGIKRNIDSFVFLLIIYLIIELIGFLFYFYSIHLSHLLWSLREQKLHAKQRIGARSLGSSSRSNTSKTRADSHVLKSHAVRKDHAHLCQKARLG